MSRQYRSFAVTNFSAVNDETRPYTVKGYFTTFEQPYELFEDFDGPVNEVIDRNAFAGCDTSDVIFQYDHNGMVYARNKNGSLLIDFDDHGGLCEAHLGGTQAGRELYEAIANGLVDQMSFGFTIAKDGFKWDEETRTSRITRISKIFDISAVSIPANPNTEIHARSYLDGVIEERRMRQEMSQRAEDERQRRARAAAALELATLHI